MSRCCPRFCSEFTRPMFGLDELPKGTLDIKECFNIGKGLLSAVGISKLFLLLLTIAIMIHGWVTHPAPWFYPAYLTTWGMFFTSMYQGGSLLLTTSSSPTEESSSPVNRLVKFTWVLYSLATVCGLCIVGLYWGGRPSADEVPILVVDVTTHGIIMLITLVHGLLVDRVPLRFKHNIITAAFALLYLGFLAFRNLVWHYNPIPDDRDDDALYEGIRWRGHTVEALINSCIVMFVLLPTFVTLLWVMSLPGRKYLSTVEKTGETSNTEELEEGSTSDKVEVEMEFPDV